MRNRLIIDGIDVYVQYGVYITFGGYNNIVHYPALKPVDVTEWPDQNGIEVDLKNPRLASKNASIAFAQSGTASQYRAFISLITTGAYHVFNFVSIGRTYTLRYVGNSDFSYLNGLNLFTVDLVDDFPASYTYQLPSMVGVATGYKLDGIDLSAYGISVTHGTAAEVLKEFPAKENLTVNTSSMHGSVYDYKHVYFGTKEVRLNLLIKAGNFAQFWANYDAFLHDLTRPFKRQLSIEFTGKNYECYYKSSAVDIFLPDHCWMLFSVNLEFINLGVAI